MATHWHIGHNNAGFLPDPDDCWAEHDPKDAFLALLGELNSLAEEFDADDDLTRWAQANDAADLMEECLPFLIGGVDRSTAPDDVDRVLADLEAGALGFTVAGIEYWVKKCGTECVEA